MKTKTLFLFFFSILQFLQIFCYPRRKKKISSKEKDIIELLRNGNRRLVVAMNSWRYQRIMKTEIKNIGKIRRRNRSGFQERDRNVDWDKLKKIISQKECFNQQEIISRIFRCEYKKDMQNVISLRWYEKRVPVSFREPGCISELTWVITS